MNASWVPRTSLERTQARIIPSIASIERYKTCHRMLKYLLQLGVKLQKIHYAIEARSFPIAHSYINSNCQRRRDAVGKCESARLKLANNSLYGTKNCLIVPRLPLARPSLAPRSPLARPLLSLARFSLVPRPSRAPRLPLAHPSLAPRSPLAGPSLVPSHVSHTRSFLAHLSVLN